MDNSSQYNEVLVSIINIIVIPVLPVIAAYLIALLRKKTTEIEKNIKNKDLQKYIKIAETTIITSVQAVNQTYVDVLRKQNGILTAEEQQAAFEMAKKKTLAILGEASIQALQEVYSDFDAWLDGRIEYHVREVKKEPIKLQ